MAQGAALGYQATEVTREDSPVLSDEATVPMGPWYVSLLLSLS